MLHNNLGNNVDLMHTHTIRRGLRSSAYLHMGPVHKNCCLFPDASGNWPVLGTTFGLGLCPNIPVKKDGILILPPMSANSEIKFNH